MISSCLDHAQMYNYLSSTSHCDLVASVLTSWKILEAFWWPEIPDSGGQCLNKHCFDVLRLKDFEQLHGPCWKPRNIQCWSWADELRSSNQKTWLLLFPVWGDSAGLVKHMHGTCTCPDNTTTHAATKSIHRHQHIESKHFIIHYHTLPVVPHKAVAEVSKLGRYRRGELLWCMDGKANPLMDRKVVGVVLFGVLAVVTSTTTAGCSVV